MQNLIRITFNPEVMGGKPCIRGMRVTVGTIVGLVASGKTVDEVLTDYPDLEQEDILAAHTPCAGQISPLVCSPRCAYRKIPMT